MSEVKLRRGEPVEKALRRLKTQLNREQTLVQVRLHRRFEKAQCQETPKAEGGPVLGNVEGAVCRPVRFRF